MLPDYSMISASQIVFHITDNGVDPLEDPASISRAITAGQYGFMGKPGIAYTGKTGPEHRWPQGCIQKGVCWPIC